MPGNCSWMEETLLASEFEPIQRTHIFHQYCIIWLSNKVVYLQTCVNNFVLALFYHMHTAQGSTMLKSHKVMKFSEWTATTGFHQLLKNWTRGNEIDYFDSFLRLLFISELGTRSWCSWQANPSHSSHLTHRLRQFLTTNTACIHWRLVLSLRFIIEPHRKFSSWYQQSLKMAGGQIEASSVLDYVIIAAKVRRGGTMTVICA